MTNSYILGKQAIDLALKGQWLEAEKINLQILKNNPEDIPALLRLAKTHTNRSQIDCAKKIYRKVLRIDRYNPIAKRNLERLDKVENGFFHKECCNATALFLEEPGKTKSVNLVRLTDEKKLAIMEIGDSVNLVVNPRSISVTTVKGQYIGRLPDDLAFRLIQLVRGGNRYTACIKMVQKDKLQIFMREIIKSKRNQSIPSFPPKDKKEDYHTFMPAILLDEQPPLVMGNEEEPDEEETED